MATLIALLMGGQANLEYPAMMVAAQVYPLAKKLGCDRIRVERANGARVQDVSLTQVRAFVRAHGLLPQPGPRVVPGRDYEPRRPVWSMDPGG